MGQLINNEDVKDDSGKVRAGSGFAAGSLTAAWQPPIARRQPAGAHPGAGSGKGSGGAGPGPLQGARAAPEDTG